MAALDDHEGYRPTPQPLAQEVTHHHIAASAEPDQAHYQHQRRTITQLVDIFLDNVKSRFGASSTEETYILNTLGAFGAGKVSKRDTITALNLALSHYNDLKQDLLNVLYHSEAKWQTSDFDFEFSQPISHYFQPAHQPEVHDPLIHGFEDQQAHVPLTSSHNQTESLTTPKSVRGHTHSLAVRTPDISAPQHESHISQATSQGTLAPKRAALSSVPVPTPGAADQLVKNMLLPPKKRRSETFEDRVSRHAVNQESPKASEHVGLPTTNTAQPIVPSQRQTQAKTSQSHIADPLKPYIHSLCGKGFAARSKVRRHHWGNIYDDMETTTGCWAKYGKPNVSWDDHPSCKETAKAPTHARTASPITGKTDEESHERSLMLPPTACTAPTVPMTSPESTVPAVQKLPGATTYTPDMFEEYQEKRHRLPPVVPFIQEPPGAVAHTPNLREEYQDFTQGTKTCHSYQGPRRSSFECLLDAVNLAVQFETQQQQGRIDSVPTQLDAQAAAERSRQYVTDWQNILGSYDNEAATSRYQHLYIRPGSTPLHPLRGYHAPLEVALPFSGRPQAHTPHMYSTTTGNSIDDPAHDRRAVLTRFSPDPHVGNRRMQDN